MENTLNNPKADFYLKIAHCKVYFDPVIEPTKTKIALTSLPPDIQEEIRKRDNALFTTHPNTFIFKSLKMKSSYTPYIEVKFGKLYSVLDKNFAPITIDAIKKGTECSAIIWGKEWKLGKRAGVVYHAETIIVQQ